MMVMMMTTTTTKHPIVAVVNLASRSLIGHRSNNNNTNCRLVVSPTGL